MLYPEFEKKKKKRILGVKNEEKYFLSHVVKKLQLLELLDQFNRMRKYKWLQ